MEISYKKLLENFAIYIKLNNSQNEGQLDNNHNLQKEATKAHFDYLVSPNLSALPMQTNTEICATTDFITTAPTSACDDVSEPTTCSLVTTLYIYNNDQFNLKTTPSTVHTPSDHTINLTSSSDSNSSDDVSDSEEIFRKSKLVHYDQELLLQNIDTQVQDLGLDIDQNQTETVSLNNTWIHPQSISDYEEEPNPHVKIDHHLPVLPDFKLNYQIHTGQYYAQSEMKTWSHLFPRTTFDPGAHTRSNVGTSTLKLFRIKLPQDSRFYPDRDTHNEQFTVTMSSSNE